MTALTADSVRQYKELGVLTECGGIEVARTEERMEELRRRVASAKAWGIEPVDARHPAGDQGARPLHRRVSDPRRLLLAGRRRRRLAARGHADARGGPEPGALEVVANAEVTGIDVEHGRVRRVRTTAGDVEADVVAIACGVWSPLLADMAGASIPLTPAVHQMIDIGPVPRFADAKSAIEYPIVRDMDTNMYERQDGRGLEIGSYAHRPILHDPEDIPSIEESALSPTEFPFTEDDFALQMEHALELMPEIVGDESVGMKYAINGLLSLTADGLPVLGETPEVKGLWSVAAVWVKEGPGVGRGVAEWMTHGQPEIDLQSSDIARFYPCQRTRAHVRARAAEHFNKTYGIVHPGEQWARAGRLRLPPFHAREQELGAVFYEAAGWERPHWYASNEQLLADYDGRVATRDAEWDSRWWSPIINAEHLAMRDRAACSTSARSASSTSPAPARWPPCSAWRCARWTCRSGASSTRRSSRHRAASARTSRSCGSARTTSASSPAAPTGWPTSSGSPTTPPRTAAPRSTTSRRRGRRSGYGARARATSSAA